MVNNRQQRTEREEVFTRAKSSVTRKVNSLAAASGGILVSYKDEFKMSRVYLETMDYLRSAEGLLEKTRANLEEKETATKREVGYFKGMAEDIPGNEADARNRFMNYVRDHLASIGYDQVLRDVGDAFRVLGERKGELDDLATLLSGRVVRNGYESRAGLWTPLSGVGTAHAYNDLDSSFSIDSDGEGLDGNGLEIKTEPRNMLHAGLFDRVTPRGRMDVDRSWQNITRSGNGTRKSRSRERKGTDRSNRRRDASLTGQFGDHSQERVRYLGNRTPAIDRAVYLSAARNSGRDRRRDSRRKQSSSSNDSDKRHRGYATENRDSRDRRRRDESTNRVDRNVMAGRRYKEKPSGELDAPRASDHGRPLATMSHGQIRFPKLEVPHFTGQFEEFAGWWDTYKQAIHRNPGLTDLAKMMHLKNVCKGEALATVEGFEVTGSNYKRAIEAIWETYNQPQVIHGMIFSKLRALPMSSGDTVTLRSTYQKVLNSVTMLREYEDCEDSIATLDTVKEKFPTLLQELNKEECRSGRRWKMHRLLRELNWSIIECETLARLNQNRVSGTHQVNLAASDPVQVPAKREGTSRANGKQTEDKICLFCQKGGHSGFTCINGTTLEERSRIVRLMKRCHLCFEEGHYARTCESKFVCSCGGRHAQSLCFKAYRSETGQHGGTQEKKAAHFQRSGGASRRK